MNKKDYEQLARAIRCARYSYRASETEPIEAVVNYLITELADDNPRFDKEKFVKACQI